MVEEEPLLYLGVTDHALSNRGRHAHDHRPLLGHAPGVVVRDHLGAVEVSGLGRDRALQPLLIALVLKAMDGGWGVNLDGL